MKVPIGWIGTILLAAVTGVGGYVVADFTDFRSDERSAFRAEYIEAQSAAKLVLHNLQMFADQANDKYVVSDKEKNVFRERVTELYQGAKEIAQRVPEAAAEFQEYEEAIVALQSSALAMTGSLNAKPFVESYSRFLKAQEIFDAKVRSVRSDYVKSLL
jgi:hypothetical protein